MRIFKTKRFKRLSGKAGITNAEPKAAAEEINRREYEADLGGGVFKKRIARSGAGKSGGYRVILFFRQSERLIFYYVFAKSALANIEDDELKEFKATAKHGLEFTEKEMDTFIKAELYEEIP
jgi:hypothetical protein